MSRSRSHPRPSRVLLIVLGLFVAVGVIVFAHRYRQNQAVANEGGATPTAAAPAAATPAKPSDEADAVVTQTPTVVTAVTPAPATTTPSNTPTAATPAVKSGTSTETPAKPQAANPIASSNALADAKAKADEGKPLEARDLYNKALISSALSPDDARAAKLAMAKLNEKIVFSREITNGDAWAEKFEIPPGGVLAKIAKRYNITPELLMRINGINDARRIQANQKIKVIKGPLHAIVDKSDFTLDVYFGAPGGEGSQYLTTFRVGLGKDDSTPTGKWVVEPGKKLQNPTYYSPRGEGVIGPDDPKNPLGEYWIALTGVEGDAVGKDAYGIHGTIEPESIGTMASMGCIRLADADIAAVYSMLIDGKSTVVVVE